MIPEGAVTNRPATKNSINTNNRRSFSQIVQPGQKREIVQYFRYIFDSYGEILTTVDIAAMTGLDRSTVLKLVKSGHIKSIEDRPKYLIPKKYLLEFVGTQRFIGIKSNSEFFLKVLGGFEIWKTAKSSL
jgi:excisionase family DNA binding protein